MTCNNIMIVITYCMVHLIIYIITGLGANPSGATSSALTLRFESSFFFQAFMYWVHVIKVNNCTLHWVYNCCFVVSILSSSLHGRELVVYQLSTLFFPCFLPLHDHLSFSLSVSTHLQPHRCELFRSLVMSTVPPASRYVYGPLKATGVFPWLSTVFTLIYSSLSLTYSMKPTV